MGFKEMRESAHIRQSEVAKVLGVTQGAVANWETGLNKPTADNLVKLAALYRCSVDDLLRKPRKETANDKKFSNGAV